MVTIDESIAELTVRAMHEGMCGYKKRAKCMRMGIAALKEVQKARGGDPALDGELLPGEKDEATKDST